MQLPRDPSNVAHGLTAAFPTRLAGAARTSLAVMPKARIAPIMPFEVEVQGETVAIPSRIYNEEPGVGSDGHLSGTQQVILHCLYSRHHDGRVRQRHLERVVASGEPWVVPFVMQLAGEHVLEIIEVIDRGLPGLADPGSPQRRAYGEFIARNPAFFARTERRVVSYWSCYYRWKYRAFETYPGGVLLEAFRAAVVEQVGAQWPRHTPRARRQTRG
ncbi:hypothetical protein PUR33_37440 [Streptomyces sp. BE282]|uniref:hypothetical protein n=1 Tax=Streptomyces sp. BE282 TaxID=3002527 RepID=UPI002E7A777A|nr:hypothetical protein [Streptomyces sp. BE282]MEE1734030.1 hypothetical protein [Streptomyces sp. BE282]MEE1734819.1 hypothetical protein [Streptomyces sp. BE282]